MAKEQDCLPPVTIGGINITSDLIDALNDLIEGYGANDAKNIIAENCLFITSLQGRSNDIQQIDSEFYNILNTVYRILKALNGERSQR